MNPLRSMLLCLLLLCAISSASGELQLKVGCDRDYPPFSVSSADGVTGFDADFIKLLAASAGFSPEFVPCSWATVLQSLEQDELDIVTAIIYTDHRSELFEFTIPYITDYYTLFSHEGAGITVPEDTEGRILAILRDDAALERFIIPGGMDKQLILTDTYAEAIMLVQQGLADYTIAPYSLGTQLVGELDASMVQATGRNLFPVSYRLAVRKGNHDLLFRLNEGIAVLSRNGELHELRKKWFPGTTFAIAANHPGRQLFARIFINLFGALVLFGVAYLSGYFSSMRQTRKIRYERDCLNAVIDTVPVGIRWHNLTTGLFSENRFWRESHARMKNFRANGTGNPDVQHFTGADGEENWIRFRKTSFVTEKDELPLTVFIMEDITGIRLLENTIGQLARERTRETARLLVQHMSDPETGFFSAEFLGSRLRSLLSAGGESASPCSVLSFSLYPDEYGSTWKNTAAPLIRDALRRIDYPGYSRTGQLIILLPEADRETAEHCAQRLLEALDMAGLEYPSKEYRSFCFPDDDIDALIQSIET